MFLRLKNGKFEVRKTLSRGEWGVTHDDAGRIYRNTNESALHVDLVPTRYFARNPKPAAHARQLRVARRHDDRSTSSGRCGRSPAPTAPISSASLRPDGTLAEFTAVCAPTVYRGDRLPAELYGNVFVAEPAAQSRQPHHRRATTARRCAARKAYERGEFLASTDERFRPVYLSTAPDGTLYIVDMYRGVIQQRADITEYLRDHIVPHKLEAAAPGSAASIASCTRRRGATRSRRCRRRPPAQLVETLSHPNGWWRDTAQRLLVERGDRRGRCRR